MNNKPAERTQVDELQDEYSLDAGIDTGTDTLTRSEFGKEADINYIASRFGITGTPPSATVPTFGDIDFDMDLQQALTSIDEAQRAYNKLPDDLKAHYRNWQDLLHAVHTGKYAQDVAAKNAAAAAPPIPPAP